MKAVLGYLPGILVLCRITKVRLFRCDEGMEFGSFKCHSETCCIPEDNVVQASVFIKAKWYCIFGGYSKVVERPNKTCVINSSVCSVTLSYCYLKETPSSSTTTVTTFSSSTQLANASNSPITFENTPTSTSGITKSTKDCCSSSTPKTKAVKVSSVGVIVGVSVAVLVLTIFGVFILLAIRIRSKITQKRITEATSKRAITFSNRGYMNVSTDIIYSAVEKGTRTMVTEQTPILEFRNYYNYRNVPCTDSSEENAYDSTDLQTNHAVKEDTYDHTVSVVNNHAVIEDTYDHTVNIVNNHAVIDDTYDHTVNIVKNHAVIDTYDHTVSPIDSHAVIEDMYNHTVSGANSHAVIDDTYEHTVSVVNNHAVIDDTYDHTVRPVNSHVVIEDTYGYEPC
ncbi:hypothetical protein ACJMK2_010253 [Sinanodonta woodiana]|uniref:Uncharacterized protein n=1 Tax=Sinanodonta woodiana TaxID=1069815 RepID=A0ABD3VF30_SINWO